jgi:hypothetical protein
MLSKITTRTVERTSAVGLSCSGTDAHCESNFGELLKKAILLMNSLSLDAPFVGIIWLWCLSYLYSRNIEFHHYVILFSVTWLAYSGDRLLDSIRIPAFFHEKPPRHLFATMHFKPLMCTWALVAVFSILYLFHTLNRTEFGGGFCLLAMLLIYFLACFYFPSQARGFLPRELLVGLFFSTATHFFILIQLEHWSFYSVWTSVCFLSLCSLNCLAISRWEHRFDRQAGEVTYFTANPEQIHRFRNVLSGFICLQVFACCFLIFMQLMPIFEISVLTSTLLLLILDRCSLHPHLKPVLADFALFTPCVFLSFL